MGKASKGLSGAGSGAAAGAAIGSVVPGIGTLIGGIGGGLLGGLGGLLGDDSDQKAMDQLAANQQIYGGINMPNFKDYKPEDYQYVGDYDPKMAQSTQISEDPSLRSSQMSALSKLAGLADTGLSDVDQAGYEKAREIGDQAIHSGNAAAMQNAQARGIGGSGLEFMQREQAAQDGTQRAQNAGLQQAADAARQRAMYQQAYMQGLGNERGQDFQANSANAGILNQFNMANTNTANQAQLHNVDSQQGIANANTGGHNQAQQYNNGLQQTMFGDQMQKANGQSGANQNMAQGYAAQGAASQSAMNNMAGLGVKAAGVIGTQKDKDEYSDLDY